jgi:hypothetical protein
MSEGFGKDCSRGGRQGTFGPCGLWYVPIYLCLMCSLTTMIVDELHKEIRLALPGIVEWLKDSELAVRQAATNALPSLIVVHGLHYCLFLNDVLNFVYS